MVSAFSLSRVERPSNSGKVLMDNNGPGAYGAPTDFEKKKPGYTAFGSSSQKILGERSKDGPDPGEYSVSMSLVKGGSVGNFLSKTRRIQADYGAKDDIAVGPQSYMLPSTITNGKKKTYSKPSRTAVEQLKFLKKSAPSIPNRHQAAGYEEDEVTGQLVLQDVVEPGFDGTKNNAVGPGDYEPKIDSVKYSNPPKVSMRGSERSQYYKMMEKAGGQAPGPGYYNYRGIFDKFDDSDETNFLVRLGQAKKQLSASFRSGSTRNAMLQNALRPHMNHPGPGQYNIREPILSADELANKPKKDQNFLSGGERFQANMSMINDSAPGKYTIKSDFEKNKVRILKAKRLRNRSGWAQNIAFDNTETRFFQPKERDERPPPGAYVPKNYDVAANVPKSNPRAPGFGCGTGRDFEASEKNKRFVTAQEELAAELEKDIRDGVGPGGTSAAARGHKSERQSAGRNHAAFGLSLGAPRFSTGKSLVPPGPPPGAYDVRPKWGTGKGSLAMHQSDVVSRRVPDTAPGPGDYTLPSTMMLKKKARTKVMIGTSARSGVSSNGEGTLGPGPGAYAVTKSLIRKTHNILLEPDYY